MKSILSFASRVHSHFPVLCLVTLLFVAGIGTARAQDEALPVYVESTVEAGDGIGTRLLYQYREHIRRSASMSLAPTAADALLKILIVTMDPTDTKVATVYSVVFTMRDPSYLEGELWYYVNSHVGICADEKLAECSETLIATTDDAVGTVRATLAEIAKALKE